MVERLTAEPATYASHLEVFAGFSCWDGDPGKWWAEEVENHIRWHVLRRTQHVLAFSTATGLLAAVSAFDPTTMGLPLARPIEQPAWRLQVVAVELDMQKRGLSTQVFKDTFAAMRETDPQRELVVGRVANGNAASHRACCAVGIEPLMPYDDHYWEYAGWLPTP